MYANDNIVNVNYHVFVRNKANGEVEELRESHRMRYLFKPELELYLRGSGAVNCRIRGMVDWQRARVRYLGSMLCRQKK